MSLRGPRREAASGRATALVVLIHGYGADGNDLIGLAEPLAPLLPDALFVAPNAPSPCAINPMGYQWFPIPWLDGSPEGAMRAGFAQAAEMLDRWLTDTLAAEGIAPERLALVGFSQGTMMSLHVGPRRPVAPACIVGFSGRLADPGPGAPAPCSTPPVLLVHGDADEVIPVAALAEARDGLAAQGIAVEAHVRRGLGHGIDPVGLRLAAEFLVKHLGHAPGG